MASVCKVQPTQPGDSLQRENTAKPRQQLRHVFRWLISTYQRLLESWRGVQIGNRAHYSIERLLAFRDYCDRTSSTRVFIVCLLTPLPALIILLLIECIPLRSPEEGLAANYMMGIRSLLTAFFVAGGIAFLAKAVIEDGAISTIRCIGVAAMSAVCYTGGGILLAATWKYPIPFGMVLMVVPFVSVITNLLVANIGFCVLLTNLKLQNQLVRHIISSTAQSLLVVAYPTFNAIFLQLSGVEQAVFICVLPVIKFVTKQIIARVSTHVEDCIGAVLVFSVDVFNVLYVSICMQSARSSLTTVLVMSTDVCHILMAIRAIYIHTSQQQRDTENHSTGAQPPVAYVEKILATIKSLDELKPRVKPYLGRIRMFAPFTLPLQDRSKAFVADLQGKRHFQREPKSTSVQEIVDHMGPTTQLIPQQQPPTSQDNNLNANTFISITKCNCSQIFPGSNPAALELDQPTNARTSRESKQPAGAGAHRTTHKSSGAVSRRLAIEKATEEGLQVLFHTEYIILTEYIECMLPLLYAAYLLGLFHLPSAQYYPSTRGQTTANMKSTLGQLVLYGSLEFGSFIVLHFLVKRRLGYSPCYQLAFVLETHTVMIQSLLFVWILFIIPLTLVHGGKASLCRVRLAIEPTLTSAILMYVLQVSTSTPHLNKYSDYQLLKTYSDNCFDSWEAA